MSATLTILFIVGISGIALPLFAGLEIEHLGENYRVDEAKSPPHLHYTPNKPSTGNTSARNADRDHLVWKSGVDGDPNGWGYYQRNRDLGQVFNLPAGSSVKVDAVVLRTGLGDRTVLAGTPGSGVFIQFFEVTGEPSISDNGTPFGVPAKHGFALELSKADDFIVGVNYRPLRTVTGGTIPLTLKPTTESGGQPGHLQYLRWNLTGDDEIILSGGEKGSRFAFLVGFTDAAEAQGLGFSNLSWMENAPPGTLPELLRDPLGLPWWGIRREGDGTLPPTMAPGSRGIQEPAQDDPLREKLIAEALFPVGERRFSLAPTTDGYPDVCTYRTYEFYIETHPALTGK